MSTPEVINVTSAPYNATGDGTTDDSAAIQAAFDAAFGVYTSPLAQYTQKPIYFPTGTYKCNSTITFNCIGVDIFGDGPTLSTLKWGGSLGGGVQRDILRSRASGGMRYTVVKDLGFDCVSGGASDLTNAISWDAVGATNVVFQNLLFKNATVGVYCGRGDFDSGQSDTGAFNSCTFQDCRYGIRMGNLNALQCGCYGCTFTTVGDVGIFNGWLLYVGNCSFTGHAAFVADSRDGVVFEDCTSSTDTYFAALNNGIGLYKNIAHTGTGQLTAGVSPHVVLDGCSVSSSGTLESHSSGTMVVRDTTLANSAALTSVAGTISLFDVPTCTFAQLPPSSPNVYAVRIGMEAIVTDSNTTTWGATIAGSGSNSVRGRYNGSVWTVMIDETDTLMDETPPTPDVTPTPTRHLGGRNPRGQVHHPAGWHFLR